MKVNRPEIISLVDKMMKQDQAYNKSKLPSTPAAPRKDSVELSAGSEILKKELARLEEMDPSRAERLNELTNRIDAGEYKVDARELADIILQAIEEGRIP